MIRSITGWLILVTAIVWLAWDVYAYVFGIDATISVMMTDLASYTPMVPLVMGILIGHWFWPAKGSGE